MTEEIPTLTTLGVTAGELLRQYRQAQGLEMGTLAHVLRVSPAKLQSLEADRLDELPDTVFARALSLTICRHLNVDPSPVLALLPAQDSSRLALKNERGLDFPLDRSSFLPQSSLLAVVRLFTPLRWAALAVLVLAIALWFWPEIQTLLAIKEEPAVAVPAPVSPPEVVSQPSQETASDVVVTTVHSFAVASPVASAAVPVSSTSRASDAR